MKRSNYSSQTGFSLIELLLSVTLILLILGLVTTMFSRSLSTRQRESSRTDALTAAQAALNVISREVANSGYGLVNNGIVYADSDDEILHFRSNMVNTNATLTDPGEDVTYFFDDVTQSILRHDANGGGPGVPVTSIVVNRISELSFEYFDYQGDNPVPVTSTVPGFNTGRVRVQVKVKLEEVTGQVNPQDVVLISDVTLRNADYMLRQY